MSSFLIINYHLVPTLKSFRLNLQNIRIYLSLPKPFGASKLDIIRINPCQTFHIIKELYAVRTVIDTPGKIGYLVFDFKNVFCYFQWLQIMNQLCRVKQYGSLAIPRIKSTIGASMISKSSPSRAFSRCREKPGLSASGFFPIYVSIIPIYRPG